MTDPTTTEDLNAEIDSLRANLSEYDRKLQAADRHRAETAKTHATIVHGLQAQLADANEAHGNVLAKIADAAESKYADQPERLIREVRLNRLHLTTYMEKGDRADRFEIAACQILGVKSPANHDVILKAIEDLKTASGVASHRAAQLTGLAIDRGDALDRLLSILKAPLRYDGGEPLTREERIEWAIRRAPKT